MLVRSDDEHVGDPLRAQPVAGVLQRVPPAFKLGDGEWRRFRVIGHRAVVGIEQPAVAPFDHRL